jgi:hypothetical protein
MATDRKELWVGWTRDATSRYVIPDEIDDTDELIDDMAEVASGYADQMLEEYEERFGGAAGRRGSGRRRKQEAEEPET